MHAPPLKPFHGFLKQVERGALDWKQSLALDLGFPEFWPDYRNELLDDVESALTERPDDKYQVSRRKRRRFAGGAGLPQGRYHALCDPDGSDDDTMARELLSYCDPARAGVVRIFDLATIRGCFEAEERTGVLHPSATQLLIHFSGWPGKPSPFILAAAERDEAIRRELEQNGDKATVSILAHYTVRRTQVQHVFDLRTLQAQDFAWENLCAPIRPQLRNDRGNGFVDLLPNLLTPTHGGDDFTDQIGQKLREHGAEALIYPSARSDCSVRYNDYAVPSHWAGWNLVDYRGTDPPTAKVLNAWSPRPDIGDDMIKIERDGRGWKVHNLALTLLMDLEEREYAVETGRPRRLTNRPQFG